MKKITLEDSLLSFLLKRRWKKLKSKIDCKVFTTQDYCKRRKIYEDFMCEIKKNDLK